MKRLTNQKGFTLIELVVVIVILGILAVTAAPRFINLQDDAQTSTLQAVEASMQSAATLVHSKSLIAGNQDAAAADAPQVTVNGTLVDINFGYPRSDDAAEWTDNLLQIDANDFEAAVLFNSIVIRPTGSPAPAALIAPGNAATAASNCYTYYTESQAVGALPVSHTVECL